MTRIRGWARPAVSSRSPCSDRSAPEVAGVAAQTRAADFLLGTGNIEAAFDRLLDVVRRSAGEDRDSARKHLVELFAVVGDDDPRVGTARRQLTLALF